jgi:hypothetical protein
MTIEQRKKENRIDEVLTYISMLAVGFITLGAVAVCAVSDFSGGI